MTTSSMLRTKSCQQLAVFSMGKVGTKVSFFTLIFLEHNHQKVDSKSKISLSISKALAMMLWVASTEF